MRLAKDLAGKKVPSKTSGSGSVIKARIKKKKRPAKIVVPPPPLPPGVPENWTPIAHDTDTRDLTKKPPVGVIQCEPPDFTHFFPLCGSECILLRSSTDKANYVVICIDFVGQFPYNMTRKRERERDNQ